jgi:hypothetical protein
LSLVDWDVGDDCFGDVVAVENWNHWCLLRREDFEPDPALQGYEVTTSSVSRLPFLVGGFLHTLQSRKELLPRHRCEHA